MTDIHTLANQVLNDRLQRCVATGVTAKGRTRFVLTGEPTPAETEWDALRAFARLMHDVNDA